MEIYISKDLGISINQQIKAQLRYLIISNKLKGGTKLPGLRELSTELNVNRHTLAKAYKDLEEEGLIESKPSLGTYVAEDMHLPKKKVASEFLSLVQTAMQQSLSLGYSKEDFISVAQALTIIESNSNKIKGLFLECNAQAIEQYVNDLENELGIDIEGCLIDDLIQGKFSQSALSEFRFILTTVSHYPEVKRTLNNCENIYGISTAPNLTVLGKLLSVTKYSFDMRIGIFCITANGANSLRNALVSLGIHDDNIVTYAMKGQKDITSLIKEVDLIIVSNFLTNEKYDFKKSGKPVLEYRYELDKSSIKMLKQMIQLEETFKKLVL